MIKIYKISGSPVYKRFFKMHLYRTAHLPKSALSKKINIKTVHVKYHLILEVVQTERHIFTNFCYSNACLDFGVILSIVY